MQANVKGIHYKITWDKFSALNNNYVSKISMYLSNQQVEAEY